MLEQVVPYMLETNGYFLPSSLQRYEQVFRVTAALDQHSLSLWSLASISESQRQTKNSFLVGGGNFCKRGQLLWTKVYGDLFYRDRPCNLAV